MKFVEYQETQVYRIVGTFRTATQIVLGADETIEHVALGDTVSWEVAVAGHILFLKPRERAGPTNLIVTTNRGGELRNYAFELTARRGPISSASANTYFQVRFRYPRDEAERAARMQAVRDSRTSRGKASRLASTSNCITEAADARVSAAARTMATAEETYRLARIAYEAGKSPLSELLVARHGLGAARGVVADAAAARFDARAQLASLSGMAITGDPVQ